jgi:hypothetical protein
MYMVMRDFVALLKKQNEPGLLFRQNQLYLHFESLNTYHTLSFLDTHFYTHYSTCVGNENLPPRFLNLRSLVTQRMDINKYRFFLYVLFSSRYSIRYYRAIDEYFEFYSRISSVLDRTRPGAFFFANDHSPVARSMIAACDKRKIPTYYYQHSSVSPHFPPLRFHASFLFGRHSLDTYRICGKISSDVHLVGVEKFDTKKSIIVNKDVRQVRAIGVCYGISDAICRVDHLVHTLLNSRSFPRICVRPHPRESRPISSALTHDSRLVMSDPHKEKPEDFLSRVDIVVADTSGILLEAALMNLWAIQTDLRKKANRRPDYYGFLRKGIVDHCADYRKIVAFISENRPYPNIRNRACDFDASIGSNFEFAVGNRVAEILREHYNFEKYRK